jgi:uncharacterized protein with PIN domain
LLKRNAVTHGYYVRHKRPLEQAVEILRRFDLASHVNAFTRCLHCNGTLNRIDRKQIEHRLEENTRLYYKEFALCPNCDRIYWKGSHYARMVRQLLTIRERLQMHEG